MLTKIKTVALGSLCGALLAVIAVGCTNDQQLISGSTFNGTFFQIDREGRALVEELYTPWGDHNAIARSAPSADAGTLSHDIFAFMTSSLPNRSPAIATYVQSLFALAAPLPPAQFAVMSNVLVVDVAQPGPAHYLGIETSGQITGTGGFTPSTGTAQFGGRALTDDVMAITLGLTFGSLVPEVSGIPDDGREQDGRNGRPNLANDFVGPSDKHFQIGPPYEPLAFPYLGNAI
jgi:hypothetical protein